MEPSRPVFIVGAARSGTTLLAEILSAHPDFVYLHEVKYIWRYRRPWAASDVRSAVEATPAVRDYIRRKLGRHLERGGGGRLLEKTPSNCFRIPFIREIFPDGRFLHLVRDGRDATFSALGRWTSPAEEGVLGRRLSSGVVPLRDAPFYALGLVREVVARRLLPQSGFVWGPRFPGIRQVRRERGVLAACAIQWRESVAALAAGLATVPPERQLELRFEELVRDPVPVLERVLRFADVPRSEELLGFAAGHVDPGAAERWRSRDPDQVAEIEPLIAPTLERLGYQRSRSLPPRA